MNRIIEALTITGNNECIATQDEAIITEHDHQIPDEIIESMNVLYQNISSFAESHGNVIQFIGTKQEEGTSTLIRWFAREIAGRHNKKVLLLDVDRNHHSQLEHFKLPARNNWDETVRYEDPTKLAKTQVGTMPLFISEIRNGSLYTKLPTRDKLNEFFSRFRKEYDFVLLDSTPFAQSSDALSFSSCVDGIVVVVELERTRTKVVEKMIESIKRQGGKIVGVVLNKKRFYIPNFLYNWL